MPNLSLPTPGVTTGPGWASQLNTEIEKINTEVDNTADIIENGRLSPDGLSAAFEGMGGAQNVLIRKWSGSAYPALPSSKPAGAEMVRFLGPVQPTGTNVGGGFPSWVGNQAGQVPGFYDYMEIA